MTASEPARPQGAPHEAHVEQAGQRLASLVVLRQIQAWLARDAADRQLQARAWRLVWVLLATILSVAAIIGLQRGWLG